MLPKMTRARHLQAAPQRSRRADHHADGARRGDRQGARAWSSAPTTTSRSRSRCASCAQARAGGAGARPASVDRAASGAARSVSDGGVVARRRSAAGASTDRVVADLRRVRDAADPDGLGPGRVFTRGRSCSRPSGARRLPRCRGRSTCTCATCAEKLEANPARAGLPADGARRRLPLRRGVVALDRGRVTVLDPVALRTAGARG